MTIEQIKQAAKVLFALTEIEGLDMKDVENMGFVYLNEKNICYSPAEILRDEATFWDSINHMAITADKIFDKLMEHLYDDETSEQN